MSFHKKNHWYQAFWGNGILELARSLPSQVPHFCSLFARSSKRGKMEFFHLQNWSGRYGQVDVSNSHIMVSAWSDSSFMSQAIRVWSMAPYTLLLGQCTLCWDDSLVGQSSTLRCVKCTGTNSEDDSVVKLGNHPPFVHPAWPIGGTPRTTAGDLTGSNTDITIIVVFSMEVENIAVLLVGKEHNTQAAIIANHE